MSVQGRMGPLTARPVISSRGLEDDRQYAMAQETEEKGNVLTLGQRTKLAFVKLISSQSNYQKAYIAAVGAAIMPGFVARPRPPHRIEEPTECAMDYKQV